MEQKKTIKELTDLELAAAQSQLYAQLEKKRSELQQITYSIAQVQNEIQRRGEKKPASQPVSKPNRATRRSSESKCKQLKK